MLAMSAAGRSSSRWRAWLREQRARLSKNSETGKAIDYSLKRWAALTRFLDDGRLCMSNNAAERELRAVAVGRKNWTFAGSDEGASYCPSSYLLINQALPGVRHRRRRTAQSAAVSLPLYVVAL